MNMETGTGIGGSPFEYAVAEQKTLLLKAKRIALILFYVLWCAALLLLGNIVYIHCFYRYTFASSGENVSMFKTVIFSLSS